MKNTRSLGVSSDTSQLPNPGKSGWGSTKYAAVGRAVSNIRHLSVPLRIALATLVVVSVSGCFERLAQKHEYFAPTNDTNAEVRLEAERQLIHHRAVQVARRGCTERGSFLSADSSGPPGITGAPQQMARAEDAWVRLCGDPKGAYAAHGAPFNAHRRWVDDQVRELPEPSDTASSVGGDS